MSSYKTYHYKFWGFKFVICDRVVCFHIKYMLKKIQCCNLTSFLSNIQTILSFVNLGRKCDVIEDVLLLVFKSIWEEVKYLIRWKNRMYLIATSIDSYVFRTRESCCFSKVQDKYNGSKICAALICGTVFEVPEPNWNTDQWGMKRTEEKTKNQVLKL